MCDFRRCKNSATCAPKLCVPAEGWPIDLHQPMAVLIGLEICDACFKKLDVDETMNTGGKDNRGMRPLFEIMTAQKGCPPDFARAFFTKVSLGSDEWKTFERLRTR